MFEEALVRIDRSPGLGGKCLSWVQVNNYIKYLSVCNKSYYSEIVISKIRFFDG